MKRGDGEKDKEGDESVRAAVMRAVEREEKRRLPYKRKKGEEPYPERNYLAKGVGSG